MSERKVVLPFKQIGSRFGGANTRSRMRHRWSTDTMRGPLQRWCSHGLGRVLSFLGKYDLLSKVCEGADIHFSCVLLFLSIHNVEYGPGPKAKQARERDAAAGSPTGDPESQMSEKETSIDEPEPARVHGGQTDQAPGSTAAAEDMPPYEVSR